MRDASRKGRGMPTLNQKRNGRMFIRVKTRHGPRTRQIRQEGVAWLRGQFPIKQFPSLDGLSLDHQIYGELCRLGHIYTKRSFGKYRKPYSQRPEAPLMNDDTPPGRHPTVATAPVSAAVAAAPAISSARCPSCQFALPEGAHFCPRCGRSSKASQDSIAGKLWFLAAVAVIAFLCWRAWGH